MNLKTFSLIIILLSITRLVSSQINNNILDQMNKSYEKKQQQMDAEYAQKTEQMQKDYEQRLKEMNGAFEKYLKEDFHEVKREDEVIKTEETPKPIEQPIYKPIKTDKVKTVLADMPKPVTPEIVLENAPAYSVTPIMPVVSDADQYKEKITISFFDSPTILFIDKRMKELHLSSVSPNGFSKYWKAFCNTYFQIYIESVLNYSSAKNLNDWGIYQILDITARQLFTNKNDREIWKWAILNQTGFSAKIGYIEDITSIMLPFMQEVYGKPYYSIGGYNYYVMDDRLGKKNLYTYQEDFSGANKKIDLNLPLALNFNNSENVIIKETKLPNEESYISIPLNKTTMQFLASYPQTENSVYLNAAISPSVKDNLYEHIKQNLAGLSETESVTYLLNYLHHSFEYKTDREQFGKEKMFFPDEMFYYPYSDCEDRTVLFTRLVNDLLGIDVVALTYFSHMAAAVAFKSDVSGYSFLVDSKKYTICDPTYINAPIGSVMPEYKGYTPIAIKINNNNQMSNIWQMISKTMEKDNEGKIFIDNRAISENGNYIASGWFNDQVKIGKHTYKSSNQTRDMWIATFSPSGNIKWFLPISCSGYGFTQAFNVGKKGNIYTLLNYTGNIVINNHQLGNSEQETQLILGISNQAQPFLNENIDFDVPEGKKLAFYGKYKPDGTKIDIVAFPTDKVRFDSKITVDSNNDVVVRGIIGKVEGLTLDAPINLSLDSYDPEEQMESSILKYKSEEYNNKIAPLFAAIEILSQNGGQISGLNVRNLIRKHSPDFPQKNPEIYEGLLRMQFVINKGGIVHIETYKEEKVSLFSMSIKNNTNLQIIKNDKDQYLLKILNGIDVGKAFIWFTLNSISMQSSGDMVFDYDSDHTQKTVSIDDIVD